MNREFYYSYGNYSTTDRFARKRFDIAKELLSDKILNKTSVLDIGCYDAPLFEILKAIDGQLDYVGVDLDKGALSVAQQHGAKVIDIDFETTPLPFLDDSFDIVILGEILEHLRDPAKLIQKARAILKPCGSILISLPNECTLYHRFKMLFGKGLDGTGFAPGYHLHFPTLRQDREFVQSYFEIVKVRYWYHLGIGGFGEKILNLIPEFFLEFFVRTWPSLFARGIIFLCKK